MSKDYAEEYGYAVLLTEGQHLEGTDGLDFVTVCMPEARLTLTWWDLQ